MHAKGLPKDEKDRQAFELAVQKWIETRVARHKFLRGGVVVVDAIPKRCYFVFHFRYEYGC